MAYCVRLKNKDKLDIYKSSSTSSDIGFQMRKLYKKLSQKLDKSYKNNSISFNFILKSLHLKAYFLESRNLIHSFQVMINHSNKYKNKLLTL